MGTSPTPASSSLTANQRRGKAERRTTSTGERMANRREWEQIAGGKFDANGICRMGKTVAAIAPHPVNRGLGNEYWVSQGERLKSFGRDMATDRFTIVDGKLHIKTKEGLLPVPKELEDAFTGRTDYIQAGESCAGLQIHCQN